MERDMNARIRQATVTAGAVAILLGSVSCGDLTRGRSPSLVVIDALVAASGAASGQFNGFLNSDVAVHHITAGVDSPTINNDLGKVTLRLVLKDLGSPAGEATPTSLTQVTITSYHVEFRR